MKKVPITVCSNPNVTLLNDRLDRVKVVVQKIP